MVDVATLSARVDTSDAVKGTQDLKKLGDQAERTEAQATRFSANSSRGFNDATRSASAMSRVLAGPGMRNAALQLSQVAQQASATGDPLRALAIQLPDLTIGLGTIGIAAGVAAGALLPLAAGLFSTADAADDLSGRALTALDSTTSAIEDARAAQERYDLAVQLAGQNRLNVSGQTLEALGRETQALAALAQLERVRLENQRQQLQESVNNLRAELQAQVEAMSTTLADDPGAEFVRTRQDEARLRVVQQVLSANADLVSTLREQQAELDLVNALMEDGRDEAVRVVEELIAANEQAKGLSALDFGAGGLGVAANEAARLAQNLAIARGRATDAAVGGNVDFFDPRNESGLSGVITRPRGVPRENRPGYVPPGARRRSGGGRRGGGGGISQADREMQEMMRERERILDSLKTAQDRYNDDLAQANRLLEAGVLSQEAYNAHIGQLKAELNEVQFQELYDGIESISDAIGGAIARGDDLGDAFRGVLQQMLADILSSNIQQALTQMLTPRAGPLGGGGGFLGSLFGGLLSFDGGGDTPNGPRVGGLDGRGGFMAMLHPNETVIDKTKGGVQQEVVVRVIGEAVEMTDNGQLMMRVRAESQKSAAAAVGIYHQKMPGNVNEIVGQQDFRRRT